MKYCLLTLLFSVFIHSTRAQRVIAVQNTSFQKDQLWYSCNFTQYQERDEKGNILVSNTKTEESAQKNFLNIVDYSDVAFEGISQKLIKPLLKHKNYKFTFYASRDTGYNVKNRDISKQRPLKLYIFGSQANCGFGELLSPPFLITHHEWAKYAVNLRGNKDWTHIVIYAAHDKDSANQVPFATQSFLMFRPVSQPVPGTVRSKGSKKDYDPGVFKTNAFSKLSFGGILMMYDVSPKALNVFNKDGEIIQQDEVRKDLDHNHSLDTVLNRFRGIDYLFLVMKENKFRTKKLNLISYLKTKYPWILPHASIERLSTVANEKKKRNTAIKDIFKNKDELGDLLIVEQIDESKQKKL